MSLSEQLNWIENIKGVKSLLINGNYDEFLNYKINIMVLLFTI